MNLGLGMRSGLIDSAEIATEMRKNPKKWGLAKNWAEWIRKRASKRPITVPVDLRTESTAR